MVNPNSLPDLTSAMEDYLETIFHLEQERRIARVRDIAKRLGVKMSSVSSALKSLSSKGLIEYDPHQYITLTKKGLLKAKEIVRKHQVLKRFFVQVLSLDEEIAEDNACRLEHHLDPRVIDKLVDFVDYAQMCPVDQTRWINGVAEDCEDCMKCLEEAKKRVLAKEKARRKALESGLTMVEAPPGAQVIVETFKGDPYDISTISKGMVEEGAMVEMEENSPDSESVLINIRGYQISLPRNLASEILVKPA
jgi:DtxR family Mn-dependent transcriptional regulator